MSFKVMDKNLLEMYTKLWKSVSSLMKREFDSELVYDDSDKYIKTKIKIYEDKIKTYFPGKKVLKENATYKCLPLVMLDSVGKVKKTILKHLSKSVNTKQNRLKWRSLLMI